jgi:hypothetical protein
MNELVNLIMKKTGLPQAMAQTVANTVLDFIKNKLPAPVASEVDLFLKNEGQGTGAAGMIGGLLGGVQKSAAAQKPVAAPKPTTTKKSVVTKKPVAAKKSVAAPKSTATKKPAASKKPTAAKKTGKK